jgi:hypothetical protein
MQNVWLRWQLASLISIATFVAFWALLHYGFKFSNGDALGWTALPFTIVSVLSGAWAGQKSEDPASPADRQDGAKKEPNIIQKQRGGKNSVQLQVGHDLKVTRKDD